MILRSAISPVFYSGRLTRGSRFLAILQRTGRRARKPKTSAAKLMLTRARFVLRQDHQRYIAGAVAFEAQAEVLVNGGQDLFDFPDGFSIDGIADTNGQTVQQFVARAGSQPLRANASDTAMLTAAKLTFDGFCTTDA